MSLTGAHEYFTLAAELGAASGKVANALYDVYEEVADEFKTDWVTNARVTSGQAGIHYPDSIESNSKLALGIEVEIGPNPAKKQGGMSFEFGSQNQPPHLDGARAMPAAEERLQRRTETAIGFLLP